MSLVLASKGDEKRVQHELRGIELVRTIISELVSAVVFFNGISEILSLTSLIKIR